MDTSEENDLANESAPFINIRFFAEPDEQPEQPEKIAQQSGKGKREPCRRYNKGKCTFGLSCNCDHRCSVPKCGKFGHGAHICRMREDNKSDRSPPENAEKGGRQQKN